MIRMKSVPKWGRSVWGVQNLGPRIWVNGEEASLIFQFEHL